MSDILKNVQKVMTAKAPDLKSEQAEEERILDAGSGRRTGGGGVKTSSLAERVELGRHDAAIDVAEAQASMQFGALQQEETRVNQAFNETQNRLIKQREQTQKDLNMKTDAMFQERDMKRADLDFSKEQAKIEQAGFFLRIQHAKYLQKIDGEMQKSRLRDKLRWNEETAKTIFGERLDSKVQELGFAGSRNAKQRERQLILARMSANNALELAQSALDDAKAAQMISAATSIAGAGLAAGADAGWFSDGPAISGPVGGPTVDNAADPTVTGGFGTVTESGSMRDNPMLNDYLSEAEAYSTPAEDLNAAQSDVSGITNG